MSRVVSTKTRYKPGYRKVPRGRDIFLAFLLISDYCDFENGQTWVRQYPSLAVFSSSDTTRMPPTKRAAKASMLNGGASATVKWKLVAAKKLRLGTLKDEVS